MIAIWGANGFIGRHLSLKMMNSDKSPLFFSRSFDGFPVHTVCNNSKILADFKEPESYLPRLSEVETIILLVTGSLARTFSNLDDEIEKNLEPYQNFLEALKKYTQIRPHIIYISSGGAIYGPTAPVPICENHPKNPSSPYGQGKVLIENAIIKAADNSGWAYTILRPANPIGIWGENIISYALNAAKNDKTFSIYGDGLTTRDYFCVQELADAIFTVSQNDLSYGKIYNVGSGTGHTVNEIIKLIETIINKKINVKHIENVDTDVSYNVLDCTKIKNDLSWKAQKSLKHIIQNIWENQ